MIFILRPTCISARPVVIQPSYDSFIDFEFQLLVILNSLIDFFYMPLLHFMASRGYQAITLLQIQVNFQFNKTLWPLQF